MFYLTYLCSVVEWPTFEKLSLTRLTICSLCIMTLVILIISRFGLECWIWVLIASVPDICIHFTFFNSLRVCPFIITN